METVKCEFCKNRLVKQQEWKKEFEKTHCLTCITFLEYCFNLEKALQENMEVLKIHNKNLHITIKNNRPEDDLMEAIGEKKGIKEHIWLK